MRGIVLPKHWAPSLEATPHISVSSHHNPESYMGPPVLHLCIFILGFKCRMCPRVPASLLYAVLAYERLPSNALLSDSGETWTRHWRCHLPFPSSTHPPLSQVTILFLATLWIILSFTPVLIAPNFTSMPLCSVLLLLSHFSHFWLCVVKLKRTQY